jgi:predicted dithiol-disulfide oxidoreductase (DUF899 family)
MTTTTVPHPPIVSRGQWLDERKKLLVREKELTKHRDRINSERRRLPMVKIEKEYGFDGPNGKQSLKALFEGRRQLVVYHFMFDPAWDKGCPSCTSYVSALGDLSMLNDRDTTFLLVSRAPLPKLEAIRRKRDGASRGFRHLAATSIRTFTPRTTRRSLRSNTTIGTRPKWRQGRPPTQRMARRTA